MDFWGRQAESRKRTLLLLALLPAVLGAVATAVHGVLGVCLFFALHKLKLHAWYWSGEGFAVVAAGTIAFILGAALWKFLELARDGESLATSLGAEPIPPSTDDPAARRLLNVAEEMALAAGLPVPRLYRQRRSSGINAFAAGQGPADAVVCVTAGFLTHLTRDEMQGVVAHEFSHILNGDIRLNLRLVALLHGLQAIANLGSQLLDAGLGGGGNGGRPLLASGNRKAGGTLLILGTGMALYATGALGVFGARLIKLATLRQRERLADAAAVQFTRNPAGLAGALKKIGGLRAGSRWDHPLAEEFSHLFFATGTPAGFLDRLLATHPPLAERIRWLDPAFDGVFPKLAEEAPAPPATGTLAQFATPPRQADGLPLITAAMLAALPEAERQHLALAKSVLDRLPEAVRQAARDPEGAQALVLHLLAPEQAAAAATTPGVAAWMPRLAPTLAEIPAAARPLLLDLAATGLRQLTDSQFQAFLDDCRTRAEADHQITLAEYLLLQLLQRLGEKTRRSLRQPMRTNLYSLRAAEPQLAVLLSAFVRLGRNPDPAAALARGQGSLEEFGVEFALLPAADCGLEAVAAALATLRRLDPPLKARLLAAAQAAVTADGQIAPAEAELLRVTAAMLDCPAPAWLAPAAPVAAAQTGKPRAAAGPAHFL
ncbi:MAG: M48 family metalloprotease [Lentisphaeria bacterium]|jgi:Zn-dependent protease with chaperone function